MGKIIRLHHEKAPARHRRTFTSAEALMDEVREMIHRDGRTQKQIALRAKVSESTINNIGSGKTRWPRQTTLFPLLTALGYELFVRKV